MPPRSGRLAKRISIAVPVRITSFGDPSISERATTENVSSLGVRLLTRQSKEMNERVLIISQAGHLQTEARVVYCQRVPDGRFGIGVQFQEVNAAWAKPPLAGVAS